MTERIVPKGLVDDLRRLIVEARQDVARQELNALREEDKLSPDIFFRDPYLLDFLGLKDAYSEKDLESAILREMESFILEQGAGFSFVVLPHPVFAWRSIQQSFVKFHRQRQWFSL